ncbi:hypothetical protein OCS_06206 [Ophiocordyceps sinensis CO18]|uniref:Uncharacterized protein n=1 Tax=Ophiocordyceps sinensis (strain Co18 / CGMCC 3.14243) TaxID=911162 RepID=T5A6P9_OPHSC|nr:hypothetical protein OCS_06206 [Ophiocordyceps sinensis CO18]
MPSGHDDDVLGLSSSSSAFAGLWLQARAPPADQVAWVPDEEHGLSNDQLLAMRLTSLIMGSISLLSSLFATFWFVRMSRSFRHEQVGRVPQSPVRPC